MATIAIADRSPLIREATRSALESSGFFQTVGEAADGEELAQLLAQARPDLTLTDVDLPKLAGLELIEALRKKCPTTRIVVLTDQDDPQFARRVLAAGAAGYVLKTVHGADLIDILSSVLMGEVVLPQELDSTALNISSDTPMRSATDWHSDVEELSEQDVRLLGWLAQGLTNAEIASALAVSTRTVKMYVSRVFDKLSVDGRLNAVVKAMRLGILKP